jgi:hypothetical protein
VKPTLFRIVLAAAAAAGLAAVVLQPHASAQIQAGPSYVPIGAAASGNSSTAWFPLPSSGRVVACQTTAASGATAAGIQCVATKLP